MSTNIRVDVTLQRLQNQSRQATEQNRSERQQREEALQQPAALQADAVDLASTREATGSLRESPFDRRRPAAQRGGELLVPFAISWSGVLSGGYDTSVVTLLRTYEVFGSGTRHDIITTTYSGGRELTPSPLRFASGNAGIASPEIARKERWRSDVVTCNVTPTPEGGGSCAYSLPNNFPNLWLTGAREETFDPYVPVTAAPSISLPVGQVTYSPSTAIVTVGNDGTVYLVFDLPKEPKSLTERSYDEFIDAGYPENTLITDYDLVDLDYSFAYDPWRGIGQYIYSPQNENRYIFIKSKGKVMESKVATRPASQALKDFLYENLYDDDPSKAVRGVGYTGEYRLRGSTAKFLWLNDGEGGYVNFPFNYLQDYKNANDVPELPAGAVFEDCSYALEPWSTPSQLKAQLETLAAANPTVGNPAKQVQIKAGVKLFAAAKEQLGNDPGDEITPRLYLAIGQ